MYLKNAWQITDKTKRNKFLERHNRPVLNGQWIRGQMVVIKSLLQAPAQSHCFFFKIHTDNLWFILQLSRGDISSRKHMICHDQKLNKAGKNSAPNHLPHSSLSRYGSIIRMFSSITQWLLSLGSSRQANIIKKSPSQKTNSVTWPR